MRLLATPSARFGTIQEVVGAAEFAQLRRVVLARTLALEPRYRWHWYDLPDPADREEAWWRRQARRQGTSSCTFRSRVRFFTLLSGYELFRRYRIRFTI